MRNWLIQKRKNARLSKRELSNLISIHESTIGKYEIGIRTPSVTVAKKIAEILNFDWTLFFKD